MGRMLIKHLSISKLGMISDRRCLFCILFRLALFALVPFVKSLESPSPNLTFLLSSCFEMLPRLDIQQVFYFPTV